MLPSLLIEVMTDLQQRLESQRRAHITSKPKQTSQRQDQRSNVVFHNNKGEYKYPWLRLCAGAAAWRGWRGVRPPRDSATAWPPPPAHPLLPDPGESPLHQEMTRRLTCQILPEMEGSVETLMTSPSFTIAAEHLGDGLQHRLRRNAGTDMGCDGVISRFPP